MTPDTAARPEDIVRESLLWIQRSRRPGALKQSRDGLDALSALLSELATARRDLDFHYADSERRGNELNKLRSELATARQEKGEEMSAVLREPTKPETRIGWWFMRRFRRAEVARRTARNKVVAEAYLAALSGVTELWAQEIARLEAELATARRERDGAILESDERGAKWNAAEAELVVVQRQLEAVTAELHRWVVAGSDYSGEAAQKHADEVVARAVLDAGQDADADDRWHNQIGDWCEQRNEQ